MNAFLKFIIYTFLLIIVGFILFTIARGIFCSPNKDVEKIAFPLAKAIVKHIENNGISKALPAIEGLPYQLNQCTSSINEEKRTDYKTKRIYVHYREKIEQCFFQIHENLYSIRLRVGEGTVTKRISVYVDIEQKNTQVHYEVHNNGHDNRWDYKFFPQGSVGYIHGTGFCKPQPLRITQ